MRSRADDGGWFDRVDRKVWILVALVAIAGSFLCTGGRHAEKTPSAADGAADVGPDRD